MFLIEEINDLRGIESRREEFEALINKCAPENPFLSYEWLINWCRHFAGDLRLIILLVREDNLLLAIVPLALRQVFFAGLPLTKIEFVGTGEANYLDFISQQLSGGSFQAILEHLKEKYRWNIIDLIDISELSSSLDVFKKGGMGNFKYAVLESEICPYASLQPDWQAYFYHQLKRKSRYNIERQIKQAQAKGNLEFQSMAQNSDWERIIHQAADLYQKVWQGKYNRSSFLQKEHLPFYCDIARDFARRGWMDFSALFFDKKMIAFSLGIVCGQRFIDYLIGYDTDFSELSPGTCLLRFQLEKAFSQGLREFDFSKGREAYKARWQTAERRNYRVTIANQDFYSMVTWAIYIAYLRVRYFLKGFPALRNLRKRLFAVFRPGKD